MVRLRISRPAQADLERILAQSTEQWGIEASRRYAATLTAAMQKIAAAPEGPTTRARTDLAPAVRSFHIRHARAKAGTKVRNPVHIIYFRVVSPELIEIVRILHERMDPGRHVPSPRRSKPVTRRT